jgi:hypothetical protein
MIAHQGRVEQLQQPEEQDGHDGKYVDEKIGFDVEQNNSRYGVFIRILTLLG